MEKMWLVVQGKTNGFLPSWRRCVMLKNGVQFPCPVFYCNGLVLSTNESEMQKKQGLRELEYERGFLTGNTNLSETELFIRLVPRMWTLHPLGEKSVRTLLSHTRKLSKLCLQKLQDLLYPWNTTSYTIHQTRKLDLVSNQSTATKIESQRSKPTAQESLHWKNCHDYGGIQGTYKKRGFVGMWWTYTEWKEKINFINKLFLRNLGILQTVQQ